MVYLLFPSCGGRIQFQRIVGGCAPLNDFIFALTPRGIDRVLFWILARLMNNGSNNDLFKGQAINDGVWKFRQHQFPRSQSPTDMPKHGKVHQFVRSRKHAFNNLVRCVRVISGNMQLDSLNVCDRAYGKFKLLFCAYT
jgi:hypothetical protein